jgi:uroporphyrinogen decarboxylase
MQPREIVRRTLEFDAPARVPRNLWLLPWAATRYPDTLAELADRFPDDFAGPPVHYAEQPKAVGNAYVIGEYTDEWGSTFDSIQAGVIGEIKRPLVATWEDGPKVRPPVECLTFDIDAVNAFCKQTDKWVNGGCCARPFERMQFLRGSQNLYIDIALRPPEFIELLNRVHGFYLDELEHWAQTDVDGLNFMDDWGSQRALLISPKSWRELFKPLYRDYIELAHHYGKKIFMHSDGYITDVIPDLIELGLDALNSQVFCMGVEELGAKFAGKLTFWGEIDRQHILVDYSVSEVKAAVRRAKAAFWRNGGAIAQCEFGAGAKPENVIAVYEAWAE